MYVDKIGMDGWLAGWLVGWLSRGALHIDNNNVKRKGLPELKIFNSSLFVGCLFFAMCCQGGDELHS